MGVYMPNVKRPHCCRICPNPVCIPDGIHTLDALDFIMKRRHEHPDRRADDCPLEEIDLVRCKECKRCEERTTLNGLSFLYCLKMEVSVGSDQYCYWGERRNDE